MTIVDVVTVSVCVLVGNEGKGPIRRPRPGSTMNQRKNRKRNKIVRRNKKDKSFFYHFGFSSLQPNRRPASRDQFSFLDTPIFESKM